MKHHIYIKLKFMRILIFGGNGWIGQQFVDIASNQTMMMPPPMKNGLNSWKTVHSMTGGIT